MTIEREAYNHALVGSDSLGVDLQHRSKRKQSQILEVLILVVDKQTELLDTQLQQVTTAHWYDCMRTSSEG
jgi:hypothetical protein